MLQKHYHRLGLKKGANEEAIKKAYRKRAMQFHPDRNNHPTAEQKFIDINLSYEILMDYVEGGAPTYQTTTSSNQYQQPVYYQNTKYTMSEMEAAWAKYRQLEREEYEMYLKLPWYVEEKYGFLLNMGFFLFFIILSAIISASYSNEIRSLKDTTSYILCGIYVTIIAILFFIMTKLKQV